MSEQYLGQWYNHNTYTPKNGVLHLHTHHRLINSIPSMVMIFGPHPNYVLKAYFCSVIKPVTRTKLVFYWIIVETEEEFVSATFIFMKREKWSQTIKWYMILLYMLLFILLNTLVYEMICYCLSFPPATPFCTLINMSKWWHDLNWKGYKTSKWPSAHPVNAYVCFQFRLFIHWACFKRDILNTSYCR